MSQDIPPDKDMNCFFSCTFCRSWSTGQTTKVPKYNMKYCIIHPNGVSICWKDVNGGSNLQIMVLPLKLLTLN